MSKRKKKLLRPRVQRMNRAGRLQSARTWLPKYDGNNVLRGYCKHFAVDWRCAAKELQLLGVTLPTEYLQRRELTEREQVAKRKQGKQTTTHSKVDSTTPYVTDMFAVSTGNRVPSLVCDAGTRVGKSVAGSPKCGNFKAEER